MEKEEGILTITLKNMKKGPNQNFKMEMKFIN